MTRVLLDDLLREKLLKLVQPLELCDDKGRVVAHLIPATDLAQYRPCEPHVSEEELRRREQSTEWYTAEEVLARLGNL